LLALLTALTRLVHEGHRHAELRQKGNLHLPVEATAPCDRLISGEAATSSLVTTVAETRRSYRMTPLTVPLTVRPSGAVPSVRLTLQVMLVPWTFAGLVWMKRNDSAPKLKVTSTS
jgi:hypothetical protein